MDEMNDWRERAIADVEKRQKRWSPAFRAKWKRLASQDDWGCDYVYGDGAWRLWNAAIRHERKRRKTSD